LQPLQIGLLNGRLADKSGLWLKWLKRPQKSWIQKPTRDATFCQKPSSRPKLAAVAALVGACGLLALSVARASPVASALAEAID
jgi:hypothetical protein